MELRERELGRTSGTGTVRLFELRTAGGIEARLSTLGATLVGLDIPDRNGDLGDVALGFDDPEDYLGRQNQHFGCTTGRVANRIAGARFELDGVAYELDPNLGRHHLHGGRGGLHTVAWNAEARQEDGAAVVSFTHESPEGTSGYPGSLAIRVVYTLDRDGALRIDYEAETDAPTPVNLTNHAYWNLAGHAHGSILDHVLSVRAREYVPTDDDLIPTGAIEPVTEVLDFRRPKRIGHDIGALMPTAAGGYDHCLVLEGEPGTLREAASLFDPHSGRRLTVLTTEPCLQVYTGNSLFGQQGKHGARYPQHGAVCLEAQRWPNAINLPAFPSVVLRPGEVYRQTTEHRFSVE